MTKLAAACNIDPEKQGRVSNSKGGGTGGARGAIAPPLFTDHLKIINCSDTQNGS